MAEQPAAELRFDGRDPTLWALAASACGHVQLHWSYALQKSFFFGVSVVALGLGFELTVNSAAATAAA